MLEREPDVANLRSEQPIAVAICASSCSHRRFRSAQSIASVASALINGCSMSSTPLRITSMSPPGADRVEQVDHVRLGQGHRVSVQPNLAVQPKISRRSTPEVDLPASRPRHGTSTNHSATGRTSPMRWLSCRRPRRRQRHSSVRVAVLLSSDSRGWDRERGPRSSRQSTCPSPLESALAFHSSSDPDAQRRTRRRSGTSRRRRGRTRAPRVHRTARSRGVLSGLEPARHRIGVHRHTSARAARRHPRDPQCHTWGDSLADPVGGTLVCHNDLCPTTSSSVNGIAVALLDFDLGAPSRPRAGPRPARPPLCIDRRRL
jgi:hypothetical protein